MTLTVSFTTIPWVRTFAHLAYMEGLGMIEAGILWGRIALQLEWSE